MTTATGIQDMYHQSCVCLFMGAWCQVSQVHPVGGWQDTLQKWCTAPCHQVSPLIQRSVLIAETAHSYFRLFEGSLSTLWGFGLTLWLDGADPCLFFRALFSSASPPYTHPTPDPHASQTGAVFQSRDQTLFGSTPQKHALFPGAASGRWLLHQVWLHPSL